MKVTIKHVTFDSIDPQKLAIFWSSVTGQKIENDWGGFVVLEEKSGLPHLAFYKTDQVKKIKDRVHLDLRVTDLISETNRMEKLGAKVLSRHSGEQLNWNVMADLEGNEFCISADW